MYWIAREHVALVRRPLQVGMHQGPEGVRIRRCECCGALLGREKNLFNV
jgi:hypothetical protein